VRRARRRDTTLRQKTRCVLGHQRNPGAVDIPDAWHQRTVLVLGCGQTGSVTAQGPNPGTGLLFDVGVDGAVTMMPPGAQTLDITETGLMSSGPMTLVSSFTGLLFNPSDTLTRTFMVTPNGGSPITLGSVTGGTTAGKVFAMPESFTGPYSIRELIVFNAVRTGDSFSIDDSVTTGCRSRRCSVAGAGFRWRWIYALQAQALTEAKLTATKAPAQTRAFLLAASDRSTDR